MRGEQLLVLVRVRGGQPRPPRLQEGVGHQAREPHAVGARVRHVLLEADAVREDEDGARALGQVDVLARGEDQVGGDVAQLRPGHHAAAGVVQQVEDAVVERGGGVVREDDAHPAVVAQHGGQALQDPGGGDDGPRGDDRRPLTGEGPPPLGVPPDGNAEGPFSVHGHPADVRPTHPLRGSRPWSGYVNS